jgi:predicted amidohydrolase YtcJ
MDPWASMRAAVHRATADGHVIGPDERICADDALQLFFGHPDRPSVPRTVEVGQPGDLIVLTPMAQVETLASDMVAQTIVGGQLASAGAGGR